MSATAEVIEEENKKIKSFFTSLAGIERTRGFLPGKNPLEP